MLQHRTGAGKVAEPMSILELEPTIAMSAPQNLKLFANVKNQFS